MTALSRQARCGLFLALLAAAALLAGCSGDDARITATEELDFGIYEPQTDSYHSVGDTITLRAYFVREITPMTGAEVTWSSNRDGSLGSSEIGASGTTALTMPDLSEGDHVITAVVWHVGRHEDQVTIHCTLPPRVQLVVRRKDWRGVQLAWSEGDAGRFAAYRVLRWVPPATIEQAVTLATLTDRQDTTYLDAGPPLAESASYAVAVVDAEGLAGPSRPRTVSEPAGPIIDFVPWSAGIHPTLPVVYLMQRAEPQSRLVAIDYERLELVGETSVDGFVQYMEVGDSGLGVELYLPLYSGGIAVLDPATLAQRTWIDTGAPISSVALDGRGLIYASHGLGTAPGPLCSYRRADGVRVGYGGRRQWCRIGRVPGRDELIEISLSTSPVNLFHDQFDADGQILASTAASLDGYRLGSILRLSPAGDSFVTHIWGAVYLADASLAYQGLLPRGADTFSDFAFDATGGTIYAGVRSRPAVLVYDYPQRSYRQEVATRGYPAFLFRAGDRLVAISRTQPGGSRVVVDVVAVP